MVFANKKKSEKNIQWNGQRLKKWAWEISRDNFRLEIELQLHHIMYLSTKISPIAEILYKVKGIVPEKVMKIALSSLILTTVPQFGV